ncbi:methyl-accepting chemotaxis protein [Pseudaquabacterium pictum]|uniref:Methyl-accepting chemotaxis protein n=2 Tax=Pseudaquabacterium pictum TaxID=2315236 RepID=A0A480AVR6_9BURK|nr:methyl-accepting chemotaxis protein [Rubrivivax pictus]
MGSAAIGLAIAGICAAMAWSTSRETHRAAVDLATAKADALAQSLDAFDGAATLLAERFHGTFAGAFSADFTLDEAAGVLTHQGDKLNGNFTAVDAFQANTGGVATVFMRQGDDFKRITTSLKKENGERAMGTMLGAQHPAHALAMAGQAYTGRAFLFGKPYMTRYQPVKDGSGKVVAILFTGFDLSTFQTQLEQLVADSKLFETGGVLVIDPRKKAADAVFTAHPSAKGKKVLEAYPGAEPTLAALSAADGAVVDMATPLLASGNDRWAVTRRSKLSGWLVVAEASQREVMAPHYASLMPFLGLFGLTAAGLGLGLAWTLRRQVADPLRALSHSLAAVTAGDLTRPVVRTRNDEIGELAGQAEQMRQTLVAAIAQVRQSAESIQVASSEVASGNADLSHRTEQTASNLQQTAGSLQQLTANVRQSADAAAQANQLAASAQTVAQRGGEVVSQVVSTMDEINSSSKRIADIIGTIDGIAFQTNILALNAAVEAARAGEQGRGFAVVASEVRSLAQRSAEAAREIKTLIGTSVEKVETGARLVQDAGSTMGEIVASVQRVTDVIGEITAAAAEQSEGIGQVNGAVANLDQMTQQNAALVEEGAAAAESLKDQAHRLTQVVGTFHLGDVAVPAPAAAARPSAKPAMAAAAPRPAPSRPAARPGPAVPPAAAVQRSEPEPAGADWESF